MDIQHLTSGDVICIHQALGGSADGHDQDALTKSIEAVLKVDEYGFSLFPDIYTMASAYLTEIIARHPFASGNDLTAWFTAKTFLAINDVEIEATPDDVMALLDGIHDGGCGEGEIVQFMHNRSVFDDPPDDVLGAWDYP